MESPQCALNDLSRQQPRLYRALGFPPLPNGCLKPPSLPATASLSSWHVEVNPLAWRIRRVCPLGEPSLSMGFLPTHHLPNPPICCQQAEPRAENVGEMPSLSSYLSQLQEHKDVPINVHHHLSCFHQPSHCVLLCDTHTARNGLKNHRGGQALVHPLPDPSRGPQQGKESSGASPNRPGKATGDLSLLPPARKPGLEQDFPTGVEVGSEGDWNNL